MPSITVNRHTVQPRHYAGMRRYCTHPDCRRPSLAQVIKDARIRLAEMARSAEGR